MEKSGKKILCGIADFVLITAPACMVPFVVAYDALVLAHGVTELSATEIAQEVLLFLSVAVFARYALREPDLRPLLVLVAGFFGCMLVRECDALFDRIYHGFWVGPALAIAAGSIGFSMARRKKARGQLAVFMETRSYTLLACGLGVIAFSRVFGSGNLLWKPLMGDAYLPLFKTSIQEGLELFGYTFIFFGALKFSPRPFEAVEGSEASTVGGEAAVSPPSIPGTVSTTSRNQ